jgi:hypothetical protein
MKKVNFYGVELTLTREIPWDQWPAQAQQELTSSGHWTLFLIFFASQRRRMKPFYRLDWMF